MKVARIIVISLVLFLALGGAVVVSGQDAIAEEGPCCLPFEDAHLEVGAADGQTGQVTTTIVTSNEYASTEFVVHIHWKDRLGNTIYSQRFHHWPGFAGSRVWDLSNSDIWSVTFEAWVLGGPGIEVDQSDNNRFYQEVNFIPLAMR